MNVEPATIHQVRRGQGGRMVLVTDDVGNVAADLHDIDPALRVRWSQNSGHWAVYQDHGHRETLVLTALELDQRVVERVREITHPSYDYARDVDRLDREAERAKDHRVSERIGETGERLAHALRKDLGAKGRIHVPKGV